MSARFRCSLCGCFCQPVYCSACGSSLFVYALASGPRRAETAKQAQGVAGQSGPEGNAHD